MLIAKDRMNFREIYGEFSRRIAGAWLCEVESTSRSEAHMLDVAVFTGRVGIDGLSSILYRPFLRPTCKTAPLTQTSCHPKGMTQWSKSYMQRLGELSARRADWLEAGHEPVGRAPTLWWALPPLSGSRQRSASCSRGRPPKPREAVALTSQWSCPFILISSVV